MPRQNLIKAPRRVIRSSSREIKFIVSCRLIIGSLIIHRFFFLSLDPVPRSRHVIKAAEVYIGASI